MPRAKQPVRRKATEKQKLPLRLEYRTPEELAENPKNWRTHPQTQIDSLTGAISEVGWAGACLFNERTERLIDGHARRKVAMAQGTKRIPVLIGDWSEEDEAKILATLDPLSAMATADAGKLQALMESVSTGSDALQEMLKGLADANPLPISAGAGGDDWTAPDPNADDFGTVRPKLGDVWLVGGRHRVACGDSTEAGVVAKCLAGATPFLMVTDPPYGVEYDPNWRNEAAAKGHIAHAAVRVGDVANDDQIDWTEAWKLSPAKVAYCWHAGRHASSTQLSLETAGYEIRLQIIWGKSRFAISRGHYHWQHEPCWYAVRKGSSADWIGDHSQTTLWAIELDKNVEGGHSTQKPLECMARGIRNHKGDVYDPFLGSGTTLIAAHRLGRTCYGCEIEPKYCEVILRRAEAEGLTVERAK